MTPERARDRAALIAAQDADAPKLADRLDAEAMRVLVAEFDRVMAALVRWADATDKARCVNLLLGMTDHAVDVEYRDAGDALMRLARGVAEASDV